MSTTTGWYMIFYFKGRDERQWKLLEEELTKSSFLWNIESAPEGMMQVKVVASDRLSNPERIALRTEKESEPFDLDHTPTIGGVAGTGRELGDPFRGRYD